MSKSCPTSTTFGTFNLINLQEEVWSTLSKEYPLKCNLSLIYRSIIEILCDSKLLLQDEFSSNSLLFVSTYLLALKNPNENTIQIIFSIQTTLQIYIGLFFSFRSQIQHLPYALICTQK